MQITWEHKLACSWLPASELDFFLNVEFSTLSLLEIRLQNTTAESKTIQNSQEHRTQLKSVWLHVNWNVCLAFVSFFNFDDKSRDKHEINYHQISLLARKSTQ